MKPAIVIATHQRIDITTVNISILLPHGFDIVLVVSDPKEAEYFSQFPIHIVTAANDPLGTKWQTGVDYCRDLGSSAVILCGSDDILSKHFLTAIVNRSHSFPFIGLRSWYVYHAGKLYHLNYQAPRRLPLGGGRVYNERFLKKVGYEIFDTGRNRLLDDLGWHKARQAGNYLLINQPEILAVKGNWPVMNEFTTRHRNIAVMGSWDAESAKQILKEKFSYDC